MGNNKSEYRRKGGRLEGHALSAVVAKEVNGMMLAQAYVIAKSAGFKLQINKYDGVPRQGLVASDGERVMVDVVSGIVRKSWAVS
jgi:hypothetical protein